jgi:hypothetical protein
VKEQSHKEEMSAAIRGDFQRLRERGVPATLVPHEETRAAPEPPPEPDAAGAGDEDEGTADASPRVADAAVGSASMPSPPGAEDEAAEPPRPGWLARLVGL